MIIRGRLRLRLGSMSFPSRVDATRLSPRERRQSTTSYRFAGGGGGGGGTSIVQVLLIRPSAACAWNQARRHRGELGELEGGWQGRSGSTRSHACRVGCTATDHLRDH